MSVFHCSMLDVMLVNNICIVWIFIPARVGIGLVAFVYCFHKSTLIGSPVCSLWSNTAALCPLLLPLWQLPSVLLKSSLWWPVWWNLHSPPKRDCLHIQMILYHLWYQKNLLNSGFRPWYLWECNETQCDDLVAKMWIIFLPSLFPKNVERIATGIHCPSALGPYKRVFMCHSLITLAASRTESQPQTW